MNENAIVPPRVEDIKRFAPRASQMYIEALTSGWPAIRSAGITTSLRWCHFMAQCHHETGGFTIVRENTSWSAKRMCELWPHRFKMTSPVFRAKYKLCADDTAALADLAYGGGTDLAEKLGNTEEGDGWAYRGGGFLQGTGRSWYREVGEAIGHDLEGSPDLIENPTISLQATLWYWTKHKINGFADQNNLRAVGNQINRGNPYSKHAPIGAEDRKRQFDRAWAIWGDGVVSAPAGLDVGSTGPEVQAVQLRLRELRYAVGSPDGVFGPETGRAVAAFKADWQRANDVELEPRTLVGPKMQAALAEAEPIERPERESATLADLRASGSTEAKAGQEMRLVGTAATGIGAIGVAEQSGVLETIQSSVGWLAPAKMALTPVLDATRWAAGNLPFVALVAIGLLVFYRGHVVEQARLLAHRLGFNLNR